MSPEPSPAITNMDIDSLVHISSYLTLQDVSNMASSCKFLYQVSSSDLIWQRFFRERWPQLQSCTIFQKSGAREAYLSRHTDLNQFKFVDPLVADLYADSKPFSHIYLNRNNIFFSQGSSIKVMNIESFLNKGDSFVTLSDHRARITCMRMFPLHETSLFRSELQTNENVLVTSSCDHSIRLWWKGCSQRCFRGHNGPVFALSDKLLGDGATKVFASGGEDGTVRLWSLSSSGKRGQHALKTTLYGHEKSVVLTSVAGHNASLLVSMSKDSKVRVWDATASSSVRDSSCVGRTCVPGTPVSLKCHDSLLYVAAGSSVSAVDLRTMKKVFSTDNTRGKLYSFETMPSKYLICTGGNGRAMLWDIRKISDTEGADPITELDGHDGPVSQLHMDQYKIITGGSKDSYINVWEAGTGAQTNLLICSDEDGLVGASSGGCSAMAVNGCRIVTGTSNGEVGVLRFRDFDKATNRVAADSLSSDNNEISSKFWGLQCYSDADESES